MSSIFQRHKKKLLVITGVVAGGYFLVEYIKSKFFELQSRLALDQAARDNLRRRFEQNQQDATFTIMALMPSLTTQILDKYAVEAITNELQTLRTAKSDASDTASEARAGSDSLESSAVTDPLAASKTSATSSSLVIPPSTRSKSELWNDVKILALTRLFTAIYASSLLVFFTRLQLNILGRKNYVISVMELAKNDDVDIKLTESTASLLAENGESSALVEHTNRLFLTFSWWLLNKGWLSLSENVKDAVVATFGEISPRKEMTMAQLQEAFGNVQFSIEEPISLSSSALGRFSANLLPPKELETYVLSQVEGSTGSFDDSEIVMSATLSKLLDETHDFLESPNAANVINRLAHNGISNFVKHIKPLYTKAGGEDKSVKLASILAVATKQAHVFNLGSPYEPNEYITQLLNTPELDGFSALVYSNFEALVE